LLLTPPFDAAAPDPGYIRGYPPGIRENGGQYTHAAAWTVMALAALGEGDKAGALFAMLNPINHTRDRAAVHRYKVEPYVMAADVYSVAPHTGRGGWSWYTGSAGWMYRLIVESLLGIRLVTTAEGARLVLAPCLPADWPGYTLDYRFRETPYRIEVTQAGSDTGRIEVVLDGRLQADGSVPLMDDGEPHRVSVRLAAAAAASAAPATGRSDRSASAALE
jgi:cellobiose phosphorylase